jgi:xylose dehydrogenase (NAD/NADP)
VGVAWGVLSTARINRLVLEGARESELVDVVAVASRDPARAQAFAAEYDIPVVHGSYEALLEDPAVEAVYIPLPNSMHVEWSVRALDAGKHVLCEKPLAARTEDAEQAFDAAERAGRLLSEAFMYRHHPQTRRLAELVADGVVGEPRIVCASFSFLLDDPADVRMLAALAGGSLMDVGCYCVSGARFIAGAEPERVFGEAVVRDAVDVRFTGTLRFPGDLLAHFHCGFDLPARHDLEVIGPEGSLFLADPWHCREPGIELRREGAVEQISIEPANSYRLELDDMSEAIRDGRSPLLGRDDALGQARAIEALVRSAAQREPMAV